MKIFVHVPDGSASSYYRAKLPVMHSFHHLSCKGIKIVASNQPDSGEPFDAYIFQRIIKPDFWNYIKTLKKGGKKIIYQTDDNIFAIPESNPAFHKVTILDLNALREIVDQTDALIVSTNNLSNALGRPEKTHVLPNLLDMMDFQVYPRFEDKPLKILWTGSYTHSEDLEQVIEPIFKVIEKYQHRIKFIFWGYFPPGLFEEVNNQFVPKYKDHMVFLNWMEENQYFTLLSRLQPDITLGPLKDCEFNQCKSSLKSLEAYAVGSAFIGSDLPPYQWMENGRTGVLVNDEWYDAMCEMIENIEKRNNIIKNARECIWQEHCWQSEAKNKWLEALESFV